MSFRPSHKYAKKPVLALLVTLALLGLHTEGQAKSWVTGRNSSDCNLATRPLSRNFQKVFASRMAVYSNQARRAENKRALKANRALAMTAKLLASNLSRRGFISHDGFPEERNRLLRSVTRSEGLSVRAENLAKFQSCSSDPRVIANEAFKLWIQSSSHRQTILGSYRFQGVSIVKRDRWYYATALFY